MATVGGANATEAPTGPDLFLDGRGIILP